MTRFILPVLVVLTAAGTGAAQQVLEIDYSSGRVLIDDEERGIQDSAIDHLHAILYVHDLEAPEGVMAFSLETGQLLRTIRFATGGGPRELPKGFAGMSVGSDGRLYVSGLSRILEFDNAGQYIDNWTPRVPERRGAVCDFGGRPAVPTLNGVVRRTDDAEEFIGPGSGRTTPDMLWRARIACTPNAAYVVLTHPDDTDSLIVYYRSGRTGTLTIPPELAEAATVTTGPKISTDGHGNVVLSAIPNVRLVRVGGYRIAGVLLDPQSGCHTTIRNPEPNKFEYSFRGIYADSAVVAIRPYEESVELGRKVFDYASHSDKVGLYPLRRTSGDPCSGMLESVK